VSHSARQFICLTNAYELLRRCYAISDNKRKMTHYWKNILSVLNIMEVPCLLSFLITQLLYVICFNSSCGR
jgi:hypothetical protein